MKTSFKFFGLLVLLLLVNLPMSGQALEKSLLWEISGKDLAKSSYLFGTYHSLTNEYLEKEQPKALALFKASEGVVVEIIVDTLAIKKSRLKMLMWKNKLSALLDSTSYHLLKSELQTEMGIDVAMLEQFKPMAVATMLGVAYAKAALPAELADYHGTPMDQYFEQQGTQTGKKMVALEAIDEQASLLFDHFSLEIQASILSELLLKKDLNLQVTNQIIQFYREGNIQGMYDVGVQVEAQMPAFQNMKFLTTDRNKRWMQKLPALLQSGSQFIAVGTLHLPGPDGLIDLLRREGYTVKPVQ